MDQETLFTGSKWDILKILAHTPKSPLELAKTAKTSIANVSQQLRLLEMAGIVKSIRVPNRDKGQPRIVYSLVKDTALFIATGNKFAEKKMVDLDSYKAVILRIWSLPETHLHYYLEKAFWMLEPDLEKISAIMFDAEKTTLYICTSDANLKKKYTSITLKKKGEGEMNIKCSFVTKDDMHGLGHKQVHVLYDPEFLFKLKTEVVK
jgi:predicted transcriptional regulator